MSSLSTISSPSNRASLEEPDGKRAQVPIPLPKQTAGVEDIHKEIWVTLNMSRAGENHPVKVAESDRCVLAMLPYIDSSSAESLHAKE
jgi:hypothetical protein